MSTSLTTLPLADIDLVPPPLLWPWIAVTIAALTFAIALAIRLRGQGRPDIAATTSPGADLATLCEARRQGRIDDQQLAFELAAILRYLYRSQRLSRQRPASCPLSQHDWQTLVDVLDGQRYRRRSDTGLGNEHLDKVKRCIDHQPGQVSCR